MALLAQTEVLLQRVSSLEIEQRAEEYDEELSPTTAGIEEMDEEEEEDDEEHERVEISVTELTHLRDTLGHAMNLLSDMKEANASLQHDLDASLARIALLDTVVTEATARSNHSTELLEKATLHITELHHQLPLTEEVIADEHIEEDSDDLELMEALIHNSDHLTELRYRQKTGADEQIDREMEIQMLDNEEQLSDLRKKNKAAKLADYIEIDADMEAVMIDNGASLNDLRTQVANEELHIDDALEEKMLENSENLSSLRRAGRVEMSEGGLGLGLTMTDIEANLNTRDRHIAVLEEQRSADHRQIRMLEQRLGEAMANLRLLEQGATPSHIRRESMLRANSKDAPSDEESSDPFGMATNSDYEAEDDIIRRVGSQAAMLEPGKVISVYYNDLECEITVAINEPERLIRSLCAAFRQTPTSIKGLECQGTLYPISCLTHRQVFSSLAVSPTYHLHTTA